MRSTLADRIACLVVFAALVCPGPLPAGDAPLGVVLQANLAHVRESALTEGATVYPGEEIRTDVGGSLDLRIMNTRFSLATNSRAHFYSGDKGAVAELVDGTLAFRRDPGVEGVEVVASDVRIVTKGQGLASGQVTIESPCMITVTSVAGELEVTSGKETRTVAEKESYSVTPEIAVAAVQSPVSPDDSGYHASHTHMTCAFKNDPKQASRIRKIGPALVLAGAALLLGSKFLTSSHPSVESPTQP